MPSPITLPAGVVGTYCFAIPTGKLSVLLTEHLGDNGLGTIGEVFDAREPHMAGGCIAQAWSVAEVLRCWVKTAV